jgi:hypothetical protein
MKLRPTCILACLILASGCHSRSLAPEAAEAVLRRELGVLAGGSEPGLRVVRVASADGAATADLTMPNGDAWLVYFRRYDDGTWKAERAVFSDSDVGGEPRVIYDHYVALAKANWLAVHLGAYALTFDRFRDWQALFVFSPSDVGSREDLLVVYPRLKHLLNHSGDEEQLQRDGWNRMISVNIRGREISLTSLGADGLEGTADDFQTTSGANVGFAGQGKHYVIPDCVADSMLDPIESMGSRTSRSYAAAHGQITRRPMSFAPAW